MTSPAASLIHKLLTGEVLSPVPRLNQWPPVWGRG